MSCLAWSPFDAAILKLRVHVTDQVARCWQLKEHCKRFVILQNPGWFKDMDVVSEKMPQDKAQPKGIHIA